MPNSCNCNCVLSLCTTLNGYSRIMEGLFYFQFFIHVYFFLSLLNGDGSSSSHLIHAI